MYPPPSKIVIQQLDQGIIDVISFGKYTIHLSFENGNRLSFSAPFRFGPEERLASLPVNDFPLAESNLIRILGKPVVSAACEEAGTLHMHFSNGDVLVIDANDSMYEAYTLVIDGREYTV
jgi:hypothetical protein